MSLDADIFTTLKSLVGNRVSPIIFPQPPAVPTWPAIRYTIISLVPFPDICGDGSDDLAEPRVQLDVVALTKLQVNTLHDQVRAAMKLFAPPALWENTSYTYDEETKTYRAIMEYTIHGSSWSATRRL